MLVSAFALGCPRTFTVHLDASELTRAKPVFNAQDPWPHDRTTGMTMRTSSGEELNIDRAGALAWTGDDGSRWSSTAPTRIWSFAQTPGSKPHPFYPPRGGTWTLSVPDDSPLSRVGKYTTLTGASAAGLMVGVLFFTAAMIGPEPSFDPEKVLRNEAFILLGSAGVASLGALIWGAGSLAYHHRDRDLGKGVFRW